MTDPSPTSQISAWWDSWLNWLAAERQYAAHTLDAYARDVNTYLSFLDQQSSIKNPPERHDFRSFLAAQQSENLEHATLPEGCPLCAIFISLVHKTAILKKLISAG